MQEARTPSTICVIPSRPDGLADCDAGHSAATAEAVVQEVSSCLSLFPVLTTQLRETTEQIEKAVVGVCRNFEEMARRAREAVSQTSVLGHVDEKTGNDKVGIDELIGDAREIMARLLHRIEQTSALSTVTSQRMKEIEGRVGRLEESLGDIDKIASSARLLALNGQIEAARAGAHGAAFAIVATETSKMAQHALTTSKVIRKTIESLAKDISSASGELCERASADTTEAAQSRTDVNHALDEMAAVHEDMRQAVDHASQNSQQLARDISQAVMAMQFQDSVSQRVGHVIDMLNEVEATLRSKLPTGEGTIALQAAPAGDWASRMTRQYTMASERTAFAKHVSGTDTSSQGLGDNVELF